MLAVPFTNSSTAEFDREGGIRQSPSRKWEEMLAVTEVGVVQALCKDGMARCGYISRPGIHFKWRLLCECLTLPVSVLRGIRANRSRMARIGPYVWRRLPFARAPKGKRATRSALTANRA